MSNIHCHIKPTTTGDSKTGKKNTDLKKPLPIIFLFKITAVNSEKKSLNQLQVESIVPDSIASIHGIKEGDHLYVNGNTTFEQCEHSIKEARKRGRMIHVKANSPTVSPRPQKTPMEDCCFWRFWRAKIMPQ